MGEEKAPGRAAAVGQAELRDLIRKRWNEVLTPPQFPDVDFAQASLAAEVALDALAAFAGSERERVDELTALVAEILADFWPGERFEGISEGLRDTQARVDGYRERAGLEAQ